MTEYADAEGLNPASGRSDNAVISARLAGSVESIAGVRALAPGLRDLVATAAAKVLRRAGGKPVGVDVSRVIDGVMVRIDAHLDDTRSVAEIVDEIFEVVEADIGPAGIAPGNVDGAGRLDIDLRGVSRGP